VPVPSVLPVLRAVGVGTAALSLLVLASCGTESSEAAPATTARPTTTAKPTTTTEAGPVPAWPLTGLPIGDAEALAAKPAVVVKIDNSPDARPHVGINQADIVYEVQVEGITRFGAVFHSQPGDPVGPVRSARSTDIDLVANLHRPLLVWSGGNPGVSGQVRQAQNEGVLVDVSHSVGVAHYWRQSGRIAPHNLFTNVSAIRDNHAPADATAPGPILEFRNDKDDAPVGDIVPGVQIIFGQGVVVQYVWDAEAACWARFQVDGRHGNGNSAFLDEAGAQVCPENVVVQFAQYGASEVDARSPQAYTVGDGDALVLTEGTLVTSRWVRPAREAALTLTSIDGSPVKLTPGSTWIAVPRAGSGVGPITPEAAAELAASAP